MQREVSGEVILSEKGKKNDMRKLLRFNSAETCARGEFERGSSLGSRREREGRTKLRETRTRGRVN